MLISIFLFPLTPIVYLAGLVLIVIGYREVAKELKDGKIWQNMKISIILYILSLLIIGLLVWYFTTFMKNISINLQYYLNQLDSESEFNDFLRYISLRVLIFLVPSYFSSILSSFFFYKSNKLISKIVSEESFSIGGILMMISTILSPILIGLLIYPVCIIILIVAFFKKYDKIELSEDGEGNAIIKS